ncbi:MAG: AAA family ATPase [Candidatus Eremiobacteraeota bacterium]|nr:AAA family ATPase [Candidatus Eremiobacteraeota bacterium]
MRERYHYLETVDLRWGVEILSEEEEEARELLVLKVCLAEIQRCRPFMIVLLGDRYGWVPPERRMRAASQEAGFETDVTGRSITALEIEYGILSSPQQKRRSYFYFRESLPYKKIPRKTAAVYSDENSKNIDKLKDRIKKLMPERVRHYKAEWDPENQKVTGLEEFGKMVLEDLWRELDILTSEFIEQAPKTWQEREARNLNEFIEMRGRGFIGREGVKEQILALAKSPVADSTKGYCVTGKPGAGKSALFARLHGMLREEKDLLLLSHAAGISVASTQVDSMLKRWIGELADEMGMANPVDESKTVSREELVKEFAELLSRASQKKRVVLLIDALNEFERTPTARHLTWLPELWPDNTRLIATAIPGDESRNLKKRRGFGEIELPPLDIGESREITASICKRYHKTLDPGAIDILTGKKLPDGSLSAGNPLWLELAVDELLLLDEDDFRRLGTFPGKPEEQIRALLLDTAEKLPPDVESLYGFMLKRNGKIFGENWVEAFAGLVAITRNGLRESDLRVLLPMVSGEEWDALRFAGLRRGFRFHLVQRGNLSQWDFFHVQLRKSVIMLKLSDPEKRKRLHTRIANHLSSLPKTDPLRQTELMRHYIGADDRKRAAEYFGSLDSGDERMGAARALADHIVGDGDRGLEWVCSLLRVDLDDYRLIGLRNNYNFELIDILKNDTNLSTCIILLEAVRETLQELHKKAPDSADYARDLSVSYNKLGDFHKSRGDAVLAGEYYEKSLAIFEELHKKAPDSADYARDLSVSYNKLGDFHKSRGDAVLAGEYYEKSLAIFEELHKKAPDSADYARDLSVSYNKLGDFHKSRGDAVLAGEYYEKSLAIFEELHKKAPDSAEFARDMVVSYNKLSVFFGEQRKQAEALKNYKLCYGMLKKMKNAKMFMDPPLVNLMKRLESMGIQTEIQDDENDPVIREPPINKFSPSPPHPGADPGRASKLNREYREELKRWKSLPWWKRLFTRKPERQKEI